MKLDDTTIVLTGASSGIGADLFRELSPRCALITLSRTAPDGALEGDPRRAQSHHIPTDLGDRDSVSAAIAAIKRLSPDSIEREIAVNLTSPIELIAGLLDSLGRRPEAFILNVNSGLAVVPKSDAAVYCATKAGLDNFSRGLRAQLAGTRIRVLQAFLPLVATPMSEGRGRGKLPPLQVARRIIRRVEQREGDDHDVGKVGLLRAINRVSPGLAARIMQRGGA